MSALRTTTLAVLLAAALAPAAQAKAKPDLKVTKVKVSATTLAQGGSLTVSWKVKNSGPRKARRTTTRVVLAPDVTLGSRKQRALKRRKSARGKLTATITSPARRYSLRVCADAAKKLRERSERNNCRALAITVTAPATQPAPQPQPPVPAPAAPVPQPALPAPTQPPILTSTPTPAPFTTTITEAPQAVSPEESARFAFTANEATTGFECRLDDDAFAPCTSPYVIPSILAGDHAFEVRGRRGDTFAATARKAWRIEFEAPAPGPADAPAPAPESKASSAKAGEITLVGDTTQFLYEGANPIQKDVEPDAVDDRRAAVLRGRVTRRNGSPIDGVRVTVVDHPELGRTATRTDGGFEIAVNGGDSVTLEFEREGYVPSQRQLEVPTQEYEGVQEIVMVPYEDRVTGVDLDDDELQVAQGSTITDGDGTRRATLLLEPGTDATATLPNGETKDLPDQLNVRATEFTIGASGPAAMPGELPPTSAYTYAVEYTVDEASKDEAVNVEFDKPIVTYVDNLVGFVAGTPVPMGYYDREKGQWIAAPDGIVIKLVGEAGGLAQLDVTGDGQADTGAKLTALGIDEDELRKLAELYNPGKSLWRAAITHFTPWDYNWPYGLPDGAGGPDQGGPEGGDPPGDDPCGASGSIILCDNQVLGEQSSIAGTPYTLAYQSDRVPGRRTGDSLEIPLTGPAPPASMSRVDLKIEVAGRTIEKSFARAPNLAYTFVFDGTDAYGRPVQGRQKVDVAIDYVYPAVYRAPATFGSSFSAIGGEVLSANRTRQEISVGQRWTGVVGGLDAPASALAGWSIDVHHTYDPIGRTLYLGDGTQRSAEGQNFDVIATTKSGFAAPEGMTATADGALLVADSSAHVVRRIVPGGASTIVAGTPDTPGFAGDGGPATAALLDHPADVAVGPDGAVYVADEGNNRIRRIAGGTITTVAGTGAGGYAGDGGPATAARLDEPSDVAADNEGALYVVDRANHAVRRIAPDGIIATLAGNGAPGFAGDGGVATRARLHSPRDVAVRESDGSVFIADGGNHRVRRIDADGTIETVAGDGQDAYRGDGGLATAASLDTPSAVLPLRDGGLLIADAGNAVLRKVSSDTTISTVAGNGTPGFRGDGGPAAQARIDFPQAIALGNDETIYLADEGNDRVRALAPSLPGLSLGEFTIASEDGRSLYVFDRSGR
ncbi:MAG TPA: CARDB domain-containing protein, partial [Solirubrobacter sp.]|nr:CARDB domain-containing protein [Solirubrobacter sp.]